MLWEFIEKDEFMLGDRCRKENDRRKSKVE